MEFEAGIQAMPGRLNGSDQPESRYQLNEVDRSWSRTAENTRARSQNPVPKRPADGIDPAGVRSGSIEEPNEKKPVTFPESPTFCQPKSR